MSATATPATLQAFESWLMRQQLHALQAMKESSCADFADACKTFTLHSAGIDAVHAYRAHLVQAADTGNICGRG